MTTTTLTPITPASERRLSNRTSFSQTVENTLACARFSGDHRHPPGQ